MERIYSKGVEEVVVTRKDRLLLCRFGSELVEWIFGHGSYVRPQIAEGEEKPPKRFKSFKKEVKQARYDVFTFIPTGRSG